MIESVEKAFYPGGGPMNHFDFTGCRVMVVGDLMLDKYLSGSVERLSPEAPVPVLLREAERAVLGGAANVSANLAALGAEVIVVGVVGRDEAGSRLLDLLTAYPKLNADRLVTDPDRPTTCKIRVMSGAHQMVRIDAEFEGGDCRGGRRGGRLSYRGLLAVGGRRGSFRLRQGSVQ